MKTVRDITGSRLNTSIPVKNKAGATRFSEQDRIVFLNRIDWTVQWSPEPIPTIVQDLDVKINNINGDANISINDISKEEI